jgi:hypothetical protein
MGFAVNELANLMDSTMGAWHDDRIFPVTLFAVTIVLAVGGGAFYWYHASSAPPAAAPHTSKGSEFERVYS